MTDILLLKKAQQGSEAAREQIIEDNKALVWSIALRFRGRGAETEDIYQIGCMGMLKAVCKFDFAHNVRFSTYAVPVIMGEIKAYLRDDGIIKVSREMKTLAYKALTKRDEYINLYGTEPDISHLAQLIGTDRESLVTALEASSPCEYLYSKAGENGDMYLIDKVSYDMDKREAEIDSLAVRLAVDSLDGGEKEIIKQRYFYGRTQSEVAKELNVSQVQICRREKKILMKLKGILTC